MPYRRMRKATPAMRTTAADIFEEVGQFYRDLVALYDRTQFYKDRPLTDLWGKQNMAELLQMIHTAPSAVETIAAVHRTLMFSVNTPDERTKNLMIDWYEDYFRRVEHFDLRSLNYYFCESEFSNQQNAVTRNGRLLAPDFLRNLALMCKMRAHLALGNGRVLELGAGYGGLARVLKLRNPQMRYTIVDIPETLYFSAMFLKLNFPECKFRLVTAASQLDTDWEDFDFTFVPVALADKLYGSHFDLFINTASLGEMNNRDIRYWMDFIERKAIVSQAFLYNRFLNTVKLPWGQHRLEENACSVSLDSDWDITHWEVEPPLARCPYFETEVTRNLLMCLQRKTVTIPAHEKSTIASDLLERVRQQDWYIHLKDDNTAKLRDNVLAPDLTKNGTLFAMWESLRLHQTHDGVQLMLAYMSTLTRGKPFEESYFYQSLKT